MSDPVSNAEIEDVLSSIRRLVSEDTSPLHRRRQIAEGAKERFVLTPALRVAEEEDEADQGEAADVTEADAQQDAPVAEDDDARSENAEAAEAQPEPEVLAAPQDRFAESRQTLEQRIAELESALQQSTEEWEPDGSEVAASAASDMPSIADAPDASEIESDGQDEAPDTDTEASLQDATLDWADIEKAVADAPDFEFGETDVLLDASEAEFDDEVAAFDMSKPKTEVLELNVEEATQGEPDTSAAPMPDHVAAAIDAEASEFVAEPSETRSEDATLDEQFSAEPELKISLASSEVIDGAEPVETDDATPQTETKSEDFELFEDSAVLDEDALRDMVSQLLRDELQGVLGERITRNVRRLVRREIQRAIAMRELE